MLLTGSGPADAEKAFTRAVRARRRAAFKRTFAPGARDCTGRLRVYGDAQSASAAGGTLRVREIALEEIAGTMEPTRSALFDADFRPTGRAAARWQRLWLAEHRGEVLPPISVTRVGDAYAVRDGHHRVSVAHARGALTIDATVESGLVT